MTQCVCGCRDYHQPNCVHGCTIPEPDDGSPSVLGHPKVETYSGFYSGKKWAV